MADNNESADTPDDTREQGIEFGQLMGQLNSHDYPATGEELLAAYGDAELELPEGSQTLREILGKRQSEDGDENVRYESAEEVRQSIFNMVGSDAVGRENYSDRGASHHDETEGGEDRDKKSI
jgi:hypothetical protein